MVSVNHVPPSTPLGVSFLFLPRVVLGVSVSPLSLESPGLGVAGSSVMSIASMVGGAIEFPVVGSLVSPMEGALVSPVVGTLGEPEMEGPSAALGGDLCNSPLLANGPGVQLITPFAVLVLIFIIASGSPLEPLSILVRVVACVIPWLSIHVTCREAMLGLTWSFMGSHVQSQISASQDFSTEPTPTQLEQPGDGFGTYSKACQGFMGRG